MQLSFFGAIVWRLRGLFAFLLVLLACCFPALSLAAGDVPSHSGSLARLAAGSRGAVWLQKTVPTDAECRAQTQTPCYSPQEIHNAYSMTSLLHAGYTGAGQTIVIIDSYGSPTVEADLHRFDTDYGLPDPPHFHIYAPLGHVPFDPKNTDMLNWAQETDLDVQWAHAIAPGANIDLLTSPVAETEGVQGMPQFLALSEYALDHHLGKIISLSWGATEETLFNPAGKKVMAEFENFYLRAMGQHVSVLASAGDTGVLNPDVDNNNYPFATVSFPASSPLVTAVGGTSLYADTNGNYQREQAWNSGYESAGGGGFSAYFRAPAYQGGIPLVTAKMYRGVPDVAYNADPTTSIPVYLGFMSTPGYYQFGGTSSGTPQWAALVAIANQYAGFPLGFLNDRLYRIGSDPVVYASAFHDVTSGNNSQGSVAGYQAGHGWDPVTGWGSPIASGLIPALARS